MPWRSHIPELLSRGRFRTQTELVTALSERGFSLTQATVSRELSALGVVKIDGCYRLPAVPAVGAHLRHWKVTAGECLVVLGTEPAFAMVVAQAIDAAGLEGVLGTVAGDDTVFVATLGPSGTDLLLSWLGVSGDPMDTPPEEAVGASGPASSRSR